MCLGMNPDILAPGDQTPARATGTSARGVRTGWTHAPREPRRRGRHRDRRPLRHPGGSLGGTDPHHRSTALPLDRADVDTDQIIPAEYLKRVERSGFGPFLFDSWRADPGFVLNQAAYAGSTILITGPNFGCGSSREHAVWALEDYGFRAIIAPSFADIFRNNCTKVGLLPVELPPDTVRSIMDGVLRDPATEMTVDLRTKTVTGPGLDVAFEIDDFTGGGCSRASTTSDSRCATRTPSWSTSHGGLPGFRPLRRDAGVPKRVFAGSRRQGHERVGVTNHDRLGLPAGVVPRPAAPQSAVEPHAHLVDRRRAERVRRRRSITARAAARRRGSARSGALAGARAACNRRPLAPHRPGSGAVPYCRELQHRSSLPSSASLYTESTNGHRATHPHLCADPERVDRRPGRDPARRPRSSSSPPLEDPGVREPRFVQ